jgi:serine/threonine protein kinase
MDYMAPEQIRGEEVTAATDLYALGCVIYECVSGRPPFADRQGMKILWAHLQDEPADPVGRDDLPAAFTRALKAALRKQAADRPAGCVGYARSLSVAARIPPRRRRSLAGSACAARTARRRERPPGRPCVTTDRRYRVTTIVPFMPGWIVHVYRMTPGVVSFSLHVTPRVKVGDEANFGPDA